MGSTSSSSLTTPVTFTGSSTFSSSFQQVLQRAVSIASLPMQQLENDVSTLQAQEQDLGTMNSAFTSLQSAVEQIATAATGTVSASSSDPAVVSAQAASSTLPGTYSIEVDDVGSSSSTISNLGTSAVTDPSTENISSSLNYTLAVNGTTTNITLTSGTLDALATAINNSSAGVSATIVNLGSNASPDYRLALTSTELGPDTITLNGGSGNLLAAGEPGSVAQYKLNGSTTVLTSTSDQVTLAPGLTATLLSTSPGEAVNVTVAASDSSLSSALQNFASSYNSAVSALSTERGQNGGALAGESLVFELQNTLSQISQFVSGAGSVQDLSDLGLNLDSSGNLSFDQSQFDSQNASGVQQFLGGLTSGGFLQLANNALTGVTNSTTGMLANEFTSVSDSITGDENQISDDQDRVNTIQKNLQQQLSAADAAIAVLQEQNTYYTNLFQTENANKLAESA